MNYFNQFLGVFCLGSFWLYLTFVLIDGFLGLKDFLTGGGRLPRYRK